MAITDLFALTGRVAVVTGGAGPLGRVLSRSLAELGAAVCVVDIDKASPEELADGLPRVGDVTHAGLVCDLLDDDAPALVAEGVRAQFGRADILVNNAAFTAASGVPGYAVPFEQQTVAAFRAAADLNLIAPFALTQALLPMLRASGKGAVVNISSMYGIVGPNMGLYTGTAMGNPAAYGATKGGLAQMTRYLATTLAPDVRVNAVAPGGIERGQDPAFLERYHALTPLGRMATEEDMAGAVAFLAGDAASYVTGQLIAVDGGWTAW